MATSKRVTKAAPLRHKFSLEVSSSKTTPRLSRPRTLRGRRTAILRSERCLEAVGAVCELCVKWTMGGVLFSGVRHAAWVLGRRAVIILRGRCVAAILCSRQATGSRGGAALEEGFDLLDNLTG